MRTGESGVPDKRQYDEAMARLGDANRLSPKDQHVQDLRKEIEEKLQAAPETANIGGNWVSTGELAIRLTDDGGPRIGYKMATPPAGVASVSGYWDQDGKELDGHFTLVFNDGTEAEGKAKATIQDSDTLAVGAEN